MKVLTIPLLVVLGVLGAGIALLAHSGPAHAANVCGSREIWINDLEYGTSGGGVYWDPLASKVWTPERGWHYFAPVPARPNPGPLWVNQLDYGSRGGGFYWDPVSGQVWTAEHGWHIYGAFACGTGPEEVVDQFNDPNTSTAVSCGTSGLSLYQGFTPERAWLSGVSIRLVVGGVFPEDGTTVTVKIRSGSPTGTVIGTAATVVAGPRRAGEELLVRLNFMPPLPLQPAQLHVIEWVGGGPPKVFAWKGSINGSTYPDGTEFACNGAAQAGEDLNFITYSVNSP